MLNKWLIGRYCSRSCRFYHDQECELFAILSTISVLKMYRTTVQDVVIKKYTKA